MEIPSFALSDYRAAVAKWLPLNKTEPPRVVPEFWQQPQVAEAIAVVAKHYEIDLQRAVRPAAWGIWLSKLSKDEYELERAAPSGELSESFFGALKTPDNPQADLWMLAKSEALPEATPERVGLLSVIPGRVRLVSGETPLLWVSDEYVLVDLQKKRRSIPRTQEGIGFDILEVPLVLGRSRVEPKDALFAPLPEQARLLEGLDLRQSVFPIIGSRSEESAWLMSPPVYVWSIPTPPPSLATDTAIFYRLATEVFGLTCLPATAAFRNPSTQAESCVQAAIATVVGAGGAPTEPPLTAVDAQLAVMDWVLGVKERPPAVVDAAGRRWWPGAVAMWQKPVSAPATVNVEWLSKLPVEAMVQKISEGCGPKFAALAVERLRQLLL